MGQDIDLDAVIYPVDSEAVVEWSSSDESIFTIDENGVLTPVSPGTAVVYAKCGGIMTNCTVYVTP